MDDKIEKLNARISRLLGKKSNSTPNLGGSGDEEDAIGGVVYLIVTVICVLFLWFATGVHYIYDGYFGLIVTNGKLQEVIKGPKLDVSLPLPFSNVMMIDGTATAMKDITVDGSNDINYVDLTADNIPVNILAQFSYQITNPQQFYYNISTEKNNVDNMVRLSVVSGFHNYIHNESYALLHTSNLTIMGNQIRNVVDKELVRYGISVVKINISKLSTLSVGNAGNSVMSNNFKTSQNSAIANELINEATAYKQDQIARVRANINQYNILLAEYDKNPKTVVEQMYYDTLSAIPAINSKGNYKLLSMPVSELVKLANTSNLSNANEGTSINVRDFQRSVDRERDFGR